MKRSHTITIFIYIALSLSAIPSNAELELAGGINSLTAGRVVPAVELGYKSGDSLYSWTGTGVRNYYYYQAAHQVSYFKTWKSGTFWGGDIESGFGGGAAYSVRSFIDENSTKEEKSTDYIIGPAIHFSWTYGFVFLNLNAIFGIRDLWQHITGLTFQDVETLSVGVRF